MRYFYSSIIITIIGLGLGFYIGQWEALYIVTLLAILEVSLSFDNAVVNAKVLETMEEKWQDRFITWGMPIAVFGMRFIFPIAIVAISSGTGLFETFQIALNAPDKYHETLVSVEHLIYAFGGAFLLMVFLDFIFDGEHTHYWIESFENSFIINKLKQLHTIQLVISLAVGLTLTNLTSDYQIALAYFTGVILYEVIASADDFLNTDGVRSGIMGLLYLEVLDASFSFDGVIGAFALSSNIFIIMIGLGIGAMFVRSLTLFMLRKGTLNQYRYLEHGAHYAILVLAIIMIVKVFNSHIIPEAVVGTVGIGIIGVSAISSILANRREKTN